MPTTTTTTMRIPTANDNRGLDEQPEPSTGFLTVPDWWQQFEPETLAMLFDPVATFKEDTKSLQDWAQQRGVMTRMTPNGVAFPVFLLSEFYPINP